MLEISIVLAVILALAAAIVVILAARKPGTFTVARSTFIAAPPDRIYPMISNLRSMNAWNPFVEPDPAIRIDYSGPDSGKGAAHAWRGNRHVGEGRLEIVEAEPPARLVMRLEMLKPMKAQNTVAFTLQPQSGGTTVTWAMHGPQPLLGKLVSLVVDTDRMCGGAFEKGLASLKAKAEA